MPRRPACLASLALGALFAASTAFAADQTENGTFDDGNAGWWTTQNLTAEIIDGRNALNLS